MIPLVEGKAHINATQCREVDFLDKLHSIFDFERNRNQAQGPENFPGGILQ